MDIKKHDPRTCGNCKFNYFCPLGEALGMSMKGRAPRPAGNPFEASDAVLAARSGRTVAETSYTRLAKLEGAIKRMRGTLAKLQKEARDLAASFGKRPQGSAALQRARDELAERMAARKAARQGQDPTPDSDA